MRVMLGVRAVVGDGGALDLGHVERLGLAAVKALLPEAAKGFGGGFYGPALRQQSSASSTTSLAEA
jgi:hypothetical protein